jgi:hypothetical protein
MIMNDRYWPLAEVLRAQKASVLKLFQKVALRPKATIRVDRTLPVLKEGTTAAVFFRAQIKRGRLAPPPS